MVVAIVILVVIAFFVSMYFYRANNPRPVESGNATRISGGGHNAPVTPGQTSKVSPTNPGSIPDGTGRDKGNGNAAMSSGMQG
ncbi:MULTISPECIES: hypothetical protein [Rufibacter]|uniref:Uncharacterized protein n=1 Tax=Rufibacter quisquiliarum TaxID=1549639 RepID=A0A839GVF9_9BACT|nr:MULTISPECIES: hypothetical protein [Rufibacter]MBA9078418.1 hypothetical protein [Rufibacter quisquiliarum]